MWNVRGWSLADYENFSFRETVVELLDFDIIGLCETFLRDKNEINVDGYKWIGHNRLDLHRNARRGSGGVGVLVKLTLLNHFDYSIDNSLEDMLWVKFKHKSSNTVFNYCVCYLPPENSSRVNDCEMLYTDLMKKVYEYQNDGEIIICGDFNARCGDESDYIEGVDDVRPRAILDERVNAYGYSFLDFLVDCNLCMVNGRVGKNDYTCISAQGKSVVDYVLLPHESLNRCIDFSVHTMSDIINEYDLKGNMKIPDHSIIQFDFMCENMNITHEQTGMNLKKSYRLNEIPSSFLNDEEVLPKIAETISKIEHSLCIELDLNKAYESFLDLMHNEMDTKLKVIKKNSPKSKNSRAKPYWSNELQVKWEEVCIAEKNWLSCKGAQKRNLREHYCFVRKCYNRLLRKAKRKYQLDKQNSLYERLNDTENPREFWKEIGKLGLANERKQNIPYETVNDEGETQTDVSDVLLKWKTDYSNLFNNQGGDFEDEHLANIRENLNNNIDSFLKLDCTILNAPILHDEVKEAIYHAKLRKAVGIDNIPSEVLRNDHCVDILFKIISYSFEAGKVPDEWLKGIINPIFKSGDARHPLNYRPITLLSIPCKIYANVLNRRLAKWLDENNILNEGQNGFRSSRSCLDHIYSLHSIINNRKKIRKDTFACFVDFKKAFDTVQRDCLWFKMFSIGIHGRIVQALQSLYDSVSCSVKVNDHLTGWFPVNQGVKQGCVLSPTLFSLYVNDLANDISSMNKGVKIDNINIAILLYADDIVLIAESESDLQDMLSKLNEWCSKWRLQVNESKTKLMHFRSSTKPRTQFNFMYGNTKLEYEENYRYLGFWFNEYLDDAKSIKEITKSASRALGAVYTKYLYAGGMNYDVYTKLIETVVEPVLFYGSGVWGQRYHREVEVVLNRACRYFLGASKFAPNAATRGDMGWVSCRVKQKLETVRLWCRIKCMDENRLPKIIHKWSLNIGKSWEKIMLRFISDLNIEEHMLCNMPHKQICIPLARNKLIENEINVWTEKLNAEGDEQNGNKLRTYRKYKNTFETEAYVKLNMSRDQRKYLSRFRSGTLPLAIETGRYTRPKIPVDLRICQFCDLNMVEDETHFLLTCPLYNDIRYDLFNSALHINSQFSTFSCDEKLIFFMNNEYIQYRVGSSLQRMCRRRKQILF